MTDAAISGVRDGVARAAAALRELQQRWAAQAAPEPVLHEVAELVEVLSATLGEYAVPEGSRHSGGRRDLVGFGQVLVPPLTYLVDEADRAEVTFTGGDLYLGSGGVLHGGVAPLVFDDVLGRLANRDRDRSVAPVVRTAYLHVNYRAPAPVGTPLRVTARVARTEGRKRWLTARLTDGERLLADADGLFVAPRTD